jgi:hypothetical protein
MRELELVGPGDPVSETAKEQYAALFQGTLAPKTIAALRAATRLGDAEISKVASALAVDELAAV